jgi:hypothetical protein
MKEHDLVRLTFNVEAYKGEVWGGGWSGGLNQHEGKKKATRIKKGTKGIIMRTYRIPGFFLVGFPDYEEEIVSISKDYMEVL